MDSSIPSTSIVLPSVRRNLPCPEKFDPWPLTPSDVEPPAGIILRVSTPHSSPGRHTRRALPPHVVLNLSLQVLHGEHVRQLAPPQRPDDGERGGRRLGPRARRLGYPVLPNVYVRERQGAQGGKVRPGMRHMLAGIRGRERPPAPDNVLPRLPPGVH